MNNLQKTLNPRPLYCRSKDPITEREPLHVTLKLNTN